MIRYRSLKQEGKPGIQHYRDTERVHQVDTHILNAQGDAVYDFERVPPGWIAYEEDRPTCGETDETGKRHSTR